MVLTEDTAPITRDIVFRMIVTCGFAEDIANKVATEHITAGMDREVAILGIIADLAEQLEKLQNETEQLTQVLNRYNALSDLAGR